MASNLETTAKTCLETIIGLTDIDCQCSADLRPDDYDKSDSGRYITDPEFGFPALEAVFNSVDCGREMWTMMQKARTDAIRDFLADLTAMMHQSNTKKVPAWRGEIGKRQFSFSVTLTENTAGMILRFPRWRDARFVLTGLGVNLSAVTPLTLKVVSNSAAWEPQEFDITTTANTWAFYEDDADNPLLPLALPMFAEDTTELTYLIAYDVPNIPGVKCAENHITGCCGGLNDTYAKIMNPAGFQLDDAFTKVYEDISLAANTGFGVIVKGYLDCDITGFLCELKEFGAHDLYEVMAAAIQAKAAAKMTSMVIDSGQINRFTLKSWEELHGRRQRHNNTYAEYLGALVKNYRNELSGCWQCKSNETWRREMIQI
jgi:hypothetical protein